MKNFRFFTVVFSILFLVFAVGFVFSQVTEEVVDEVVEEEAPEENGDVDQAEAMRNYVPSFISRIDEATLLLGRVASLESDKKVLLERLAMLTKRLEDTDNPDLTEAMAAKTAKEIGEVRASGSKTVGELETAKKELSAKLEEIQSIAQKMQALKLSPEDDGSIQETYNEQASEALSKFVTSVMNCAQSPDYVKFDPESGRIVSTRKKNDDFPELVIPAIDASENTGDKIDPIAAAAAAAAELGLDANGGAGAADRAGGAGDTPPAEEEPKKDDPLGGF